MGLGGLVITGRILFIMALAGLVTIGRIFNIVIPERLTVGRIYILVLVGLVSTGIMFVAVLIWVTIGRNKNARCGACWTCHHGKNIVHCARDDCHVVCLACEK